MNTYIAITIKKDTTTTKTDAITTKTDDKYISYVVCASNSDNLLSVLKIENIQNANICSSKKKAYELARFWNECYKKNGTYLYQV